MVLNRSALAWLLAAASLAQAETVLELRTEDYPPFNMMEAGKVGGISTRLIEEMLKRLNLRGHFQLLPWARALAEAQYRPNHCVYSTVRNEQRESLFKWVGPLVDDKISLFALSSSKISLGSIAEAKSLQVGGYVSDAYGDYVEQQGVKLDRAPSDELNLQKLQAGRIALWVAGATSGPYRANRAGYPNLVRLVVSASEGKEGQMWLACNKEMPDALIARMNQAAQALIKSGALARISANYR